MFISIVILLFRELSGQESEREEAELISSALHICVCYRSVIWIATGDNLFFSVL